MGEVCKRSGQVAMYVLPVGDCGEGMECVKSGDSENSEDLWKCASAKGSLRGYAATASKPTCADRCDDPWLGAMCMQQKCAQLTKMYSCDQFYAAGKWFAGWCDKTCGFC